MTRLTFAVLLLLPGGCGDLDEGTGHPSDALFRDDELNDVHLSMAASDWDSIILDSAGDVYRHATLRWKDVTVEDVAVRPRGHSTRYPGNLKMSLKVKVNGFVAGRRFCGLKELKLDGLREGTMLRERLAYEIYRARIPASPRAVHCRLFVNDEYRGVYLIEETPNGDLVKHRFRGEDGSLYHVFVGAPEAYTWRGPDPAAYLPRPWGPETNEESGDHTVVPRFLEVLARQPADLAAFCDLDNLTDYLALEMAVMSRDGFLRDAGRPQNHFAYYSPSRRRFEFLPWDLDQTFGNPQSTWDLFRNFETTRIAAVVRDTPVLRDAYLRKVAEISGSLTHPDRLNARIDSMFEQIREAAHADPNKLSTNEQFDRYPDYLKSVVRNRYDHLQAQLAAQSALAAR
jgi:spore coat protein CotH